MNAKNKNYKDAADRQQQSNNCSMPQMVRSIIYDERWTTELKGIVDVFIASRRSSASIEENFEFDRILSEVNKWKVEHKICDGINVRRIEKRPKRHDYHKQFKD